jgi:hypothetical protein
LHTARGFDAVRYVNRVDHPTSYAYVVWEPERLRVPWAHFDPAKKGSSNLMAGVAGASILPTALMDRDGHGIR